MPDIYIIAGPNGAGKTTSAKVLVPDFFCSRYFVNADEIARAIDPIHPEKAALNAGRLMIKQIQDLIKAKKDFVFETTLSAKIYVEIIKEAKKSHYAIHLVFLYLNSPKQALKRVRMRVNEGGHNIPPETIKRRYNRGLKNFFDLYEPLVNSWFFYDNTEVAAELIAAKKGDESIIYKKLRWEELRRDYGHR